jgi:hypothetical protein
LIVVAIIALVSASVAVAAIKFGERAQQERSQQRAGRSRRSQSLVGRARPFAPPERERTSFRSGPRQGQHGYGSLGKPWRIECAESDVTIYSDGSDRIAGTSDDIRIPPT